MKSRLLSIPVLFIAALSLRAADPAPAPKAELAGLLHITGSDSMETLFVKWTKAYTALHPKVSFDIQVKGSSTSLTGLLDGTVECGFMGRRIREKETAAFVAKFGRPPFEVAVGTGALNIKERRSIAGVFVHADNPLKQLTLTQVDAIFSEKRLRGAKESITTWGQLGLKGEWADKPVHIVAIEANSGPTQFFRERALKNGNFHADVKQLSADNDAVTLAVAADRYAIGVTTSNFASPAVRALALAESEGAPYYALNAEDVGSLRYPLARQIYLYINFERGAKPVQPLKSFIDFILSERGQKIVAEDGYLPLTADMIAAERAKFK